MGGVDVEPWRDIPGYEGIYQASNTGNIRTCEGKTTYTELRGVRHWNQRTMKQKLNNNSRGRADARVSLWKDGKERTWLVARLVGLAWCEGYKDGMTINHINGNPLDNRSENLEWISLAENIRKGFETGLYAKCRKPVQLENEHGTMTFESMAAADRGIGRNRGYISGVAKKQRDAIGSDGKRYRAVRPCRTES